jgi:hypothetical protein
MLHNNMAKHGNPHSMAAHKYARVGALNPSRGKMRTKKEIVQLVIVSYINSLLLLTLHPHGWSILYVVLLGFLIYIPVWYLIKKYIMK